MSDAGQDAIAGLEQAVAYAKGRKDALSTLTPGTRFTAADGREMVVVPVEASEKMLNKMARVTYYQRAGGPTWENLKETGKALWRNRSKWAHAAMIAAASEPDAPSQASERGE